METNLFQNIQFYNSEMANNL